MPSTTEKPDQTTRYLLAGWFADNAQFTVNADVAASIELVHPLEARLGPWAVHLLGGGAEVAWVRFDQLFDVEVTEDEVRADFKDDDGAFLKLWRGEPLS